MIVLDDNPMHVAACLAYYMF